MNLLRSALGLEKSNPGGRKISDQAPFWALVDLHHVVPDKKLMKFVEPPDDGTLLRELSSAHVFQINASIPILTRAALTKASDRQPNTEGGVGVKQQPVTSVTSKQTPKVT